MSSDANGLKQTPFSDAVCPTPSATAGDQGIGGGLDAGAGANGLSQTPWANPICPTPGQMTESGPFGNPSRFSSVDGSTQQGAHEEATVTGLKNTVDRR